MPAHKRRKPQSVAATPTATQSLLPHNKLTNAPVSIQNGNAGHSISGTSKFKR